MSIVHTRRKTTMKRLEIEYLLAELSAPVVKAERKWLGGSCLTVWHKRGATADDVADRLLALGCYGATTCHDCPVYHYLVRQGCVAVSVTIMSVSLWGSSGLDHIPLPSVIAEFIRKFDSGSYEWLRKYGPRAT
jgi:hypothetical protein